MLAALISMLAFSGIAQDAIIAPVPDVIPSIKAPDGYSVYFGEQITVRATISDSGSVATIDSVEGPENACSGVETAEVSEVRKLAEKLLNEIRFTPAQQGGRSVEGKVVLRLTIVTTADVAVVRPANVPESKDSGDSKGKYSPGEATIIGSVVAEPQGPSVEPIKGPTPKSISGGVLNAKARVFPKPAYPAAARAVRASGVVNIQVYVSEEGNVLAASAVSGHPLLREAARTAACSARFSPTLLKGEPVKVTGVFTYNFVP